MSRDYEGREIRQSVRIEGVFNGRSVASMQTPFMLTEADFMRLKGGPPITASISAGIVSAVFGFGISLIPKLTPMLRGGEIQVSNPEGYTVIGGLIAAALIYLVGLVFPSDKGRVMKNIAAHFVEEKPSIRILGEH